MLEKLRARIERGDPTPTWDDRPLPFEDLEWVWAAYEELATCKPIGMAVGPIPWTAIHAYATRYGLSLEEEEELRGYVRVIDAEMDRKEEKKG